MKVLVLLAAILPYISCQLVGGPIDYQTNLTDPNVAYAVNAINEMYKGLGDARPRTAVTLLSATSQVVAGVAYTYEIEVSGGDGNEICTVKVWSRPWLDNPSEATQVTENPTCTLKDAPAPVLGGQELSELSDPETQKAYQFVETSLNAMSNNMFYVKATGVTSVTKQVVNGIIYRFGGLEFTPTTCTKPLAADSTSCMVADNATPLMTCNFEVYWNPRQTPEYVIQSQQCQ